MRNQYKVKGKLFNIAFLSPAFLVYTIFMIIPIVFSFYYSLNKWDGIGPKKFVGLKNFIRMFSNSQYLTVTSNTLTLVLLSLLITLPVSLCLAYLLYRCKHGFKFFRLAIFMPVIISAMIVGLIFSILFNADFGPVNQILKDIGLPQLGYPASFAAPAQTYDSDPTKQIHSFTLEGKYWSKEAIPIVHSAGKGGSGGVQLWVEVTTRLSSWSKRCNQ